MSQKLTFLGACGTVTGSSYLLETSGGKYLIDCGIYQGERKWRELNWQAPAFDPRDITAVLLTHAHIDHAGMLPRYFRLGMTCPIYATGSTCQLSQIMLPDSVRRQEENAEWRSDTGRSRHKPPMPLYTEADARAVLEKFLEVSQDTEYELPGGLTASWRTTGHILGASSISLQADGKGIVFSGDLGRYDFPILKDPAPQKLSDLLLIESTYGNRDHGDKSPVDGLAEHVNRCAGRGGVMMIPGFAVGRTQLILYWLRSLKAAGRIPDLPVLVDSPMAIDATAIYSRFSPELDPDVLALVRQGKSPFSFPRLHFVRDRSESMKINSIHEPMIIIAGSGMLSGGRILHHLKQRIGDARNMLLFVGYQSPGGRGGWLKSGADRMTLFGEEIPVRAEVSEISGLSGHADRGELLRWCRECEGRPGRVAVVHGEEQSASAFSETLKRELGWNAFTPVVGETIKV